jgi:DNA-binding transcriptional MerR regulator
LPGSATSSVSPVSNDEVARLSGRSPETIRHYEKLGLLEALFRSSNGHRLYDIDAVDRLGFIRHGLKLGLDLRTIGELLALADHPDAAPVHGWLADRRKHHTTAVENSYALTDGSRSAGA